MIILCLWNEWVVPSGQNKQMHFLNVLATFLSSAVLLTGLTYMHAVTIFGTYMESKRLRKNSGNSQGTSEDSGFRVDVPLAISTALLFAQGGTNDTWWWNSTSNIPYMILVFEEFIELVCDYTVVVIVRAVTGHPTQKSVLRSASISCLLYTSDAADE